MIYKCFLFMFIIVTKGLFIEGKDCSKKSFGHGSFVCECDATYCDALLPISLPIDQDIAVVISSNKKSDRWLSQNVEINREENSDVTDMNMIIHVDPKERFQSIEGFGGAFTDAAGISIMNLSQKLSEQIMRGYFDKDGLEYNMGRVPIGGSDFSTHPYTYDDLAPGQEDPDLKFFALAKEDFDYKIPLIKSAIKMTKKRNVSMNLIASPWSGPSWMKDNGQINGDGQLKEEFYGSWSSYIVRFLKSYEELGINFYGVTTQNEPFAGLHFHYSFNQMAWTPKKQGIWISEHFGPQLFEAGFESVKVFVLDDQRFFLPFWIKQLFKGNNASRYVSGIGVHWYWDFISPARNLDLTNKHFPQLPILYTEACNGYAPWDLRKVVLGSWTRAENYAKNIIEDLQHWVVGWIDWNLALDMSGGPNWANNNVDSPIIVNKGEDKFYRQPMYYALAHFAKALPRGSKRIHQKLCGKYKNLMEVVAFLRPDDYIVVIVLNRNSFSIATIVQDKSKNITLKIEARSIKSIIWKI